MITSFFFVIEACSFRYFKSKYISNSGNTTAICFSNKQILDDIQFFVFERLPSHFFAMNVFPKTGQNKTVSLCQYSHVLVPVLTTAVLLQAAGAGVGAAAG